VNGYVLDDLALIFGLGGLGGEEQRRELSRLIAGAVAGGPRLDVPALCLAAAMTHRPAIGEHLANVLADAPPGVIQFSDLIRTIELDALRAERPHMRWPAAHAVVRAQTGDLLVLTVDQRRYTGVPVDVEVL
jgi:hypothetical protein